MARREIHKNFPDAKIQTYACEEPAWTSAMPQILKSLGYSYAVLKNPLTQWGGYSVGKDCEVVNWVGPDGSSIPAVPRYVGELANGNCWNTQAVFNKPLYLENARKAGIKHPVGMCFQDAGWIHGPHGTAVPSIFRTWHEYFENVAVKPPYPDWNFSQENIRVSLMWGSQILQRVAQNVREAENKILVTEKLSTMAALGAGAQWQADDLDDAWRTLLLSQHHDCWIVPYNKHPAGNWELQVANVWIPNTDAKCNAILNDALQKLSTGAEANTGGRYVRVFNPVSVARDDVASIDLPANWDASYANVFDEDQTKVPCQVTETTPRQLLFLAAVPSLGYSTYRISPSQSATKTLGARAMNQPDGKVALETDLYKIVMDPVKGGAISSLYDKSLKREFVDSANPRCFNEYRGYFTNTASWASSSGTNATLRIVENGPVRVTVTASGKIADQPFVSTITAVQGQKRLDMTVHIDWTGDPRIGEAWNGSSVMLSPTKPCYDDRYKLQAVFPCALQGPVVLNKNAAFDVCKSANTDTFFERWDSIKHNIIVNWADINDAAGAYGFALMTDHTTSYAFGPSDPLGLVLSYIEPYGLWDKHYMVSGPSEIHYSIIPHAGAWDQAHLWSENSKWSEPLLARVMTGSPLRQRRSNFLVQTAVGTYVPTLLRDGDDLLVRLFNAEGDAGEQTVSLGFVPKTAKIMELDGRDISPLTITPDGRTGSSVKLSIPRFGVRTLRLAQCKWNISSPARPQ